MKVVDASVVLEWVLGQDAREGSHRLLENHLTGQDPLVAPELLSYEVANVVVTGARLAGDLAADAFGLYEGLEIETYSLGHAECRSALGLAAERGITVYDASYAALAQALRCPLVTADRRLARSLHDTCTVETV
jgi:predicted nucleic acid-binding protein